MTGSKGETFKAVYSVTIGKDESFTYEQAPPKSLLQTSSGSVIETGSQLLFCSSSSGANTCVGESATANPFSAIENLFSPTSAATFIKGAESQIAAKEAGYSLSFSTATYAGQPSRCVTYTGQGKTGEDCVTTSGILDYVSTPSGTRRDDKLLQDSAELRFHTSGRGDDRDPADRRLHSLTAR